MPDSQRAKLGKHHRPLLETCEPRLMMTAQSPIDVVLNTSAPLSDGRVDAWALSAESTHSMVAAATPAPTTSAASIYDLVGLTAERNTYGLTGVGQTVVVIDSGIAYDHPALGGGFGSQYRVVGGWDFAENDANPYDDGPGGGHGTHVAGIIGSSDRTSPGVATGVDLVSLRVFNDQGVGSFDQLEKALQWVHEKRNTFEFAITTVSISIGSSWNAFTVPNWSKLENEFAQLKADGIFVAVSAGNSFSTYKTPGLSYPAASPSVVPVMSVGNDGALSSFSQRANVAIAAPGQSVRSTVPDYLGNLNGKADDFASFSGTSMAAPFIAGTSALLREAMQIVGRTGITQDAIYSIMRNTADVIFDTATAANYLRINVGRALALIMPGDDFGSTASTAYNLGTTGKTTIAGLIGTLADHDTFTFTASATGRASLTLTGKDELAGVLTRVGGAASASGDTVSFDVVAGQSYTIDVSTSRGIGRYSVGLTTVAAATSIPAIDLGAVESLRLAQQNLSGEAWYKVAATRTGIVTVQALGGTGNADVSIFNAANQQIASSGGRVDVNASAGDVLYVRVRGGAVAGTLAVTNLVSVIGTTVNVSGTAGNDSFTVGFGSSVPVTVNGVSYSFAAGAVRAINISGSTGTDSITVTASSGNDSAVFNRAGLQLAGSGYQLSTSNVETIVLNAGGGLDQATLYASAGSDTFVGNPTQASLSGAGYSYTVIGFDVVDALATNGGASRANLYDSAGNDTFVASPTEARLVGAGYNLHVVGFGSVAASQTSGGVDVAYLSDSAGVDTLVALPHLATLSGAGYYVSISGYSSLQATSSQGRDYAYLYDSAGNDTLVSGPQSTVLSGAGFRLNVRGFSQVQANAVFGGNDSAELTGSTGNDTFIGSKQSSQIAGAGYTLTAKQFDHVTVNGGGGIDLATLYDSAAADVIEAAGSSAELSGSDYDLLAANFRQVNVYGTAGGSNIKHVLAVDYALNFFGQWQ